MYILTSLPFGAFTSGISIQNCPSLINLNFYDMEFIAYKFFLYTMF